jgi:gluconate 5-dehydrogenase
MQNLFDLTGRVAIVTGASSGLGVQFATALAKAGANLAIIARRAERLAVVKQQIEEYGVQCLAVKADLLKSADIKKAVDDIKKHYGRIDILVNNAGVATSAPSHEHEDEDWERVIDTNLNSVFYMSREVAKVMIKQNYGKVINLGSIHSRVAMPGLPIAAYAASKGGILMLTRALAAEWAEYGITVNAIGPSYFPSEMTGRVIDDPKFLTKIEGLCPMKRPGKPDELDGAIIYFASDASSFTTGQLLNVDGGWTAV